MKSKHTEDTWFLQTLAVIGSTLSMGAIAVLLAHYDTKPIFDWKGVTINAIVAVFAAIAKALLAFAVSDCLGQSKWIWFSWQPRNLKDLDSIDNASRGPLGSLRLLRRPVARSFITFGAVVVILSVVIDPFVQLAIGKQNKIIYKTDQSTQITYARRYSRGSFTVHLGQLMKLKNGDTFYRTTADADFGMKSAILYGISESDKSVTQQTRQTCLSNNCTWATFQSLAVCSACTDLTHRLSRGYSESAAPLDLYLGNLEDSGAIALSNTDPNTEYILPNGLRLNNMEHQAISTQMTAYGTSNQSQSITFSSRDTLLWSMAMIKVTDPEAKWPSSPVTASECGLWYCVNDYHASVEKGELIEMTSSAPSRRSPESWQLLAEQPQYTVPQKYRRPPPDTLNYYTDSASLLRTDLQLGANFNLSQSAVYSINKAMNETFSTKLDTNSSQLPNFINAYVLSRGLVTYHPTVMQILHNSSDLDATFAALAKSMTNSIRANGDDNLVAIGEAGTDNTLIEVRWPYLVLPAILVIAGGVFLGIVIYHTHATGIAIWCSNVMPSVALGGTLGPNMTGSMLLSQMSEKAKEEVVHFPNPSEASKPVLAASFYKGPNYETLPVEGPSSSRRVPTRSVSDMSDTESRVWDTRQSQIGLV